MDFLDNPTVANGLSTEKGVQDLLRREGKLACDKFPLENVEGQAIAPIHRGSLAARPEGARTEGAARRLPALACWGFRFRVHPLLRAKPSLQRHGVNCRPLRIQSGRVSR
jgi:hypothetical protein